MSCCSRTGFIDTQRPEDDLLGVSFCRVSAGIQTNTSPTINANRWRLVSREDPQRSEKPEVYCPVYAEEDYVIREDAKSPPGIGWPFGCIDFIQDVEGPSNSNDG